MNKNWITRKMMSSPQLPDDVAEGFEQIKLAIMRHKLDGWNEISEDQMVTVLYYLQRLALDMEDARDAENHP